MIRNTRVAEAALIVPTFISPSLRRWHRERSVRSRHQPTADVRPHLPVCGLEGSFCKSALSCPRGATTVRSKGATSPIMSVPDRPIVGSESAKATAPPDVHQAFRSPGLSIDPAAHPSLQFGTALFEPFGTKSGNPKGVSNIWLYSRICG